MSRPLIYFGTASLDGYRADAEGGLDWGPPVTEEVLGFINELFGPTRLHLYGRRNAEVMTFWDTVDRDQLTGASREWKDLWARFHKVIYSTTFSAPTLDGADLRDHFDVDEIARWKAEADAPVAIAGGVLASEAARAGLLDEVHVIVSPVYLGGGTRFLDEGLHLDLDLREQRLFENGSIYLRYRVR